MKLKRCPFCKSYPQLVNDNVRCINDECAISRWWVPIEEWQNRKSYLKVIITALKGLIKNE